MYNLNDIFYNDGEYSARAKFCNRNGCRIVEIEADENGRRFQIQEIPAPSELEQTQDQICQIKEILEKYKEDVEQVELFGMERTDYDEKKTACANYILQLRELETKVKELGGETCQI